MVAAADVTLEPRSWFDGKITAMTRKIDGRSLDHIGLHQGADRLRDRLRPALADEGHPHHGLDQNIPTAPDLLRQHDGCALHRDWPGHHFEHVIHSGGLEEIERHRTYHESKARR